MLANVVHIRYVFIGRELIRLSYDKTKIHEISIIDYAKSGKIARSLFIERILYMAKEFQEISLLCSHV